MKKFFSSILFLVTCSCFATDPSVADIFNKRFSGRCYDTNKTVSKEQLIRLAEAARLTPSSYNEQPWRFIFLDRAIQPDAYAKAYNSLVEFNQNWVKGAPVLVVIVANTKSKQNGKANAYAAYDTGAAAYGLMLQATHEGLMTHQMGGFDADKIRKEFAIPEDNTPLAVMTLGYAAVSEKQPEKKDRQPIQSNFFSGAWNKSL